MKPYLLAVLAALGDLVAAALLLKLGFTVMGVFMIAVAVGSFVLAFTIWRRTP